jgi:hypothetical protein
MAHEAKIVGDPVELADGAIAVTVRCCDDPSTDSVLTLYGLHELSTNDVIRHVRDHQANVEIKHVAKQRGRLAIDAIKALQ